MCISLLVTSLELSLKNSKIETLNFYSYKIYNIFGNIYHIYTLTIIIFFLDKKCITKKYVTLLKQKRAFYVEEWASRMLASTMLAAG